MKCLYVIAYSIQMIMMFPIGSSLSGKTLDKDSIRSEIVAIFQEGSTEIEILRQLKDLHRICTLNSLKVEEAMALSVISNYFNINKQYDSSLFYIKKCLLIRKTLPDTNSLARTYFLLAQEYHDNGFSNYSNFDSSLIALNKSIELAENIEDPVLKQAIYILISQNYNHSGSPEKALKNLKSSLESRPEDPYLLAQYFHELAVGHRILKDYEIAIAYIDSAIDLTSNKRAANLIYKLQLSKGIILIESGRFENAVKSFNQANKAYEALYPNAPKNELFLKEAKINFLRGELLRKKSRFPNSINFYKSAIFYLDSCKKTDELYILAYQGLAEAYAQLGDLEKGMEAYKMASEWKGKIYDQVSTENAQSTELFAENTDLKKSNLFYQELADARRRSMRIQQVAGGGILTILLFFFYQLFQRQKIQKQLIATKNQLLEEKEQTHKQRLMALTGRYNERMAQTVMQVQQEAQAKFRKQMIEVGEELHDFAQGKIAIGKTLLTKLKDDLSKVLSDQDRQNYDLISEAMNAAHQEIRDQSHRLQEGKALDLHINLEDFLHKLKSDLGPLQQIGELTLNLETENLEALAFNEKDFLDIIGLVQGAINNVILHAEAETVYVRLERVNDTFQIAIEDDGQGFEMESEKLAEASGMQALTNRIDRLGGTMNILSEPGKGTKLVAEVPIRS